MDFDFTDEELLFQKHLREGVERLIAPGFKERWHYDGLNRDLLPPLKELGLLGFAWPEEYGGQGVILPDIMHGIAFLELGRADCSSSIIFGATVECAEVLMELGTKELQDEWGPRLATGEAYCGYCFVEPGMGTDLGNIQTRGELQEDGSWIISGDKASVSFCTSDAFIVAVRTGDQPGAYGVSLFFVPADLEGVSVSIYEDFGMKEIGRGDVALRNVRVPGKYLLGEREGGFKPIMHIFDAGRPALALMCIGAAETVMEQCVEYCKQREVFGQKLSKYEAISFGLIEHKTKLDLAKMMAFKAFWLRSQKKWNAKEAGQAKFYGCEAAFESIWFCTRAFGHLGYTSEYDALYRLADVMGFAWGDGSWEVCKMVAARDEFGEEYLPYTRRKRTDAVSK